MIVRRTYTDPESRTGYQCAGKINTDSNGVGTITIKGADYSDKCTGFNFATLGTAAATTKGFSVWVVSIAYSSATLLTTITIQANLITDSGSGTTDLTAYDGDLYYSFWVDENTLPTDQSTNNTLKQEY